MDEFMERNTVERARETEIDTKNRIRGMDKRGEGEPAGTGKENKSLRLMTLLRVLLRKRFFNGTLKKKKKKSPSTWSSCTDRARRSNKDAADVCQASSM